MCATTSSAHVCDCSVEVVACIQVRTSALTGGGDLPAVPITVRQLEAVIRISESLARMQLQVDVTENHVQQAMDLFRTSTMDAVRSGATEGMVCSLLTCSLLAKCVGYQTDSLHAHDHYSWQIQDGKACCHGWNPSRIGTTPACQTSGLTILRNELRTHRHAITDILAEQTDAAAIPLPTQTKTPLM